MEKGGPEGLGSASLHDSVANLPLEFYHYYYGSNHDLGTLIEVRRTWDAYIRPGGSRIPGHWVQPPPPADEIWASYLVKPKWHSYRWFPSAEASLSRLPGLMVILLNYRGSFSTASLMLLKDTDKMHVPNLSPCVVINTASRADMMDWLCPETGWFKYNTDQRRLC